MKKFIISLCVLVSVCAFAGSFLRTGSFDIKSNDNSASQGTTVQLEADGTIGTPTTFIYVVDGVGTNEFTVTLEAIDLGVAKELVKVVETNAVTGARVSVAQSDRTPTGSVRVSLTRATSNVTARVKWGVIFQ